MLDLNEIRKRAQQASERAADSMKKTFEKSEELVQKIQVPGAEKEDSVSAAEAEAQLNANTERQVQILGQIFGADSMAQMAANEEQLQKMVQEQIDAAAAAATENIMEHMKEDKSSWVSFFQWLRGRGLNGVKLVVGDKCLGMLEAVGEVFPEAKYQRCTVHFYRNVFSVTPRPKVKLVAKMLKAVHAQESKKAAREKAKAVVEELRSMKLKEAAKKVEDGIEETLTYCDFPSEHWTRIRTNNVIERLNREIRRRTRVVGNFPDGNSALMLVCARLRHVAGTQWGNKKYMNMKHLEAALEDGSIAG